jgi:NAD(P)H-hydrate epimerase
MPAPVIDIAQMRAWEAATWASGKSEAEVIERAGQEVALRAQKLTLPGDRILILAGKGHNGDDARQAGRHLPGRDIQMLLILAPETDLATLASLLALRPALIIDGLFGIGLNRPLSPDWVRFIQNLNQTSAPILSVDVPSGLNADTGESLGAAVRASITLTLGAPKKGLLTAKASPYVGRLEVAPNIGLTPCPHRSEVNWILPEDFAGYPPARAVGTHKGTYGHLIILAGSRGYHGASVLAARGAQRARPGLVTLWCMESVYISVAARLQAVMVHPWQADLELPDSASAFLIGPGLAANDLPAKLKTMTRRIWKSSPLPVVVDASALDWLPEGEANSKAFRLVTPHPGEAARMLKTTAAKVQADRLGALRELSHRWGGCWVVLKGHQSLVGRSSGELFVNSSGNPYLAQGGSGDVLAGYLGGLLAQPGLQADPSAALRYGVWQHGAAADSLQTRHSNWVVEDLLNVIGDARQS